MLDEPEVLPPVEPEVPLGLVVVLPPPMLDVPEVPEVPDDAAGAELGFAFLDFLCLTFCFFFGVVVPAPVLSVALEEEADGWPSVVPPAPEVALEPVAPVELLPVPIGVPGVLLVLPEVEAPVPDEPEVPEVVSLAPEEDEPGVALGMPPEVPVSLAPDLFCTLGFDEGLEPVLVLA